MIFESSQDLLYIVLSLSILWFTVFLCWLLYQAARVLKNANDIVETLTQKLEMISDAVDFIKQKVDKMSGHMGVVGNMASGLVEKFVLGKISDNLEDRLGKRKAKKSSSRKMK